MSTNWTQAWVAPGDSFFISKTDQFIAPDPLIVQSTNGSTMTLTVGNDNTAAISTAGLGGLNNNEIRFEDKLISFNVDQPYDSLRVGDDVEVNTNFFITQPTASNFLRIVGDNPGAFIEYHDTNTVLGRIDMTTTGNVSLNTYVVAEPNGVFTVLSTTLASTQITGTDIVFSDTSNNPIGSIYANGTSMSMSCSGFPAVSALTINSTNAVSIDSGYGIIQQTLSNFGGLESALAFAAAAPNPNYYMINSTINSGSNGRFANQLNFMSPFGATQYNFFQLDAIGGNTNFNRGIRMYYDSTVGANSGQIAFLQGGSDGNYGGRILTDNTVNGLYISANNFGASTLGNLALFGSTIFLGTAGSPATVSVNGNPLMTNPNTFNGFISGGVSWFGMSPFPNLPTTEPGLITTVTINASMLASTQFTLIVNAGGYNDDNNNNSSLIISWFRTDATTPSTSTTAMSPYVPVGAGPSSVIIPWSSASITGSYTFKLGTDYFTTTTNVIVYMQRSGGFPNSRFVSGTFTYTLF
jgi:hypothetical protein